MNVNWEEILMDPVVQGAIITAAGGIILAVIKIFLDSAKHKKLFDEIKDKIGNLKSDTLEGQHERIKEIMIEKTNGVEKIIAAGANGIAERQRSIFSKVDSIDKEMSANKERTASLTLDQKDIRDNVTKLVNDWEHTIAENKELKARNTELEKKYMELDKQYKELLSKNRKARDMDMEIDR